MKRSNPLFSLCGLNCCLCPRFNTDGESRCPGCGGDGFEEKHPTCAVGTCNEKHDAVEYCYQCTGYPCSKYKNESLYDSFVSYKNVRENLEAARTDIAKYEANLQRRQKMLRELLDDYNDGRCKGLYCIIANDMPEDMLEELLSKARGMNSLDDVKTKARNVRLLIQEIEKNMGVEYKLRKR